jgi:hypothetical protein
MPQFHEHPQANDNAYCRSQCPQCGGTMWLICLVPHSVPRQDVRTFKCEHCKHNETVIVRFE